MNLNGTDTPHRLFGPYGTRLAELGEQINEPQLSDPVAILNGAGARKAVAHVAQEHLSSGADIATVNAFGLRGLIHKRGELQTYREALAGHFAALQRAIATQGARHRIQRVISLGPQADCYEPSAAPRTRLEAADFHGAQAAEAATLNPDAAWFETVNTAEEAIGIALASKHYGVPCVISFVLNKNGQLLSSESPQDTIRAIDSASGNYPIGYSFNCCPIEALEPALKACGPVQNRVIAVYPNASSKSPEKLEGHEGIIGVQDPHQTALYLHHLAKRYDLPVIGGCCGFSGRDIAHVSAAVLTRCHHHNLPKTDAQ